MGSLISSTNDKLKVGILGNGEIGSSLHKVYKLAKYDNVVIRDPYQGINNSVSDCDILNIAIPYFGYDNFIMALNELSLKKGCLIIIQSTIGLGTTDKIQEDIPDCICIQSPVRGVHPDLVQGLLLFDKYMGVSEKYYNDKKVVKMIKNHLLRINMKPVVVPAKESEMAKIISTTLYGVNIAAITDVEELCETYNLNFYNVFTRWQSGYNTGYTILGKKNVIRPILYPIPKNKDGKKLIGGHCVIPNCIILKNMGENKLSEFVLRYSDETNQKHIIRGRNKIENNKN